MVGYRVISHRLGQSTLHLQPIVGLRHQLLDSVLREELTRGAMLGCLPCQGLRTVFAELQLLGVICIRESATGALESPG